ncbi:amidohydrolase family protein [Pseudonocardia sp. WMMC193]|uniref:amidohydrolase family protein n=1 Tax=Pseudonocardia sp. WMMC193 TaxID=2911965 RepID=UPI001F1CEA18|nr:amidohydrolase family protein [Pseudonocardia sp. WMMC193]MCF7548029.1 amidohydrolase family protein [Pseudonocardia sp. WMMC193]
MTLGSVSADGATGRHLLLRGGHVLDPASGRDEVADVAVRDGRIAAVGPDLPVEPGVEVHDVRGRHVVPGLIDIHMHAFGGIGFSDSDTVGVRSGVTTLCDAGGAGAWSFPDMSAQLAGRLRTDLYSWMYMGPSGIAVSLIGEEQQKDIRSIVPVIPVTDMFELVDRHRDTIAGMKVPAFGPTGEIGPMTLAKGLARSLGLPLYIHVGDIQERQPLPLDMDAIIDLLDPCDTVTHCYSPNPNSLFRSETELYPSIAAAIERGVGFDVGMGAFNFDFRIARRSMELGFLPTTLSSDLQQANVTGPTYSLVNVMGMFLAMGMSLREILPMVTTNAAERLRAADRHGSLAVGRAADITVLDLVSAPTEFADTVGGRLTGAQRLDVVFTAKHGEIVYPDAAAAQDPGNWSNFLAFAEDEVPEAALGYDAGRRALLGRLADVLEGLDSWAPLVVQEATTTVLVADPLGRGDAGRAVLGAFLHPVFPQSPGYFLSTHDRGFVLERLRRVATA